MAKTLLVIMIYQPTDNYNVPVGKKDIYVSHGVDVETGYNVIQPSSLTEEYFIEQWLSQLNAFQTSNLIVLYPARLSYPKDTKLSVEYK